MIRDTIVLPDILTALENQLRIEHTEQDIGQLRLQTRQRIEASFGIQISTRITEVSNGLVNDSITSFLAQLTESLKSLSLLMAISLYDKKYSETLADVNYLGFSKQSLLTSLKYLQDEKMYARRQDFFPDLVRSIGKIDYSRIKRLLIIMVILEDLGVEEGVAIIAMYLYSGAVYA